MGELITPEFTYEEAIQILEESEEKITILFKYKAQHPREGD